MSLSHSPSIVTNGLVLHLDAASPKSYPRTGTTWFDRSPNGNDGTLVSGVGFNSGNAGYLTFDGSTQYVTPNKNIIGTITTFTVSHFIYLNANQMMRTIFSNFMAGGNGWVTGISDTVNNVIKFYLGGGSHLYATVPLTAGVWYSITASYNNGISKIYINGALNASSSTPINFAGTLTNNEIGRLSSNAQFFNGRISNLQLYNRTLSDSEILQNFNAIKGRFEL